MSRSPIIQDGKLVGAVTHVLVNDPTRGYGIFIENMFIADNGLVFKAYDQFGKTEISERVALLVQLVRLVWNDEMFK